MSSVAKIAFFIAAAVLSVYHSSSVCPPSSLEAVKLASDVCTAFVYVFAGLPAAMALLLDVVSLHIDTHVLMNLAVIGTLVAGLPLEGALLLVLFQTSHAVEHMLTAKAQGSLKTLFDSIPDHADVIKLKELDGSPDLSTLAHVDCKDVQVGQVVLVKPGCQVPLDGVIAHGQALVSAEHITGESVPVLKRPGSDVPAGSLCHDGALCVRVTRLAEDSTPAKISQLARNAQAKRPKLRTFLDLFGEMYSKAVIGATILSFVVMVACGVPVVGDPTGAAGVTKGALYRAMGLLTVASPCALVMVPMAYVSAIASLASRGILLKGGRVLDAARLCRTIAMDKTGTLTTGTLSVRHVISLSVSGAEEGVSESLEVNKRPLAIAKALSMRSSHPVSTAIIAEASKRGMGDSDLHVSDFTLVPGGGVSGRVEIDGETHEAVDAMFGSLEFVSKLLPPASVDHVRSAVAGKGNVGSNAILSVLVVTNPSSGSVQSIAVFLCEDTLREASFAAVRELQSGQWDGSLKPNPRNVCEIVMVTGDNEASANRIADKVGISSSNVYASLTPEEKLQVVKKLGEDSKRFEGNSSNKSLVMMVGDGLNDAAALAAARVGIAIASPTMAASLASDVVVMNDTSGVSTIPLLLRVAKRTHEIIIQNIVLAAGSIAVLALPTVLGFVPLWLAVMFHEGSTLLVALNSLRILRGT